MVTNSTEAIQLMAIVLRYLEKKDAQRMLNDMDFEVAENTENESLRESIKMVQKYIGGLLILNLKRMEICTFYLK